MASNQAEFVIRPATPADAPAVQHLLEQAFGSPAEAQLVAALYQHGAVTGALVALVAGQVVGHILFSPVTIESQSTYSKAVGLAPLAVLPAYQQQGIGTHLIRAGLLASQQAGYDLVVVLGHPDYYRRFAFMPAKHYGLRCAYVAPDDDAFMVLALQPGALNEQRGMVRYHPAFDAI